MSTKRLLQIGAIALVIYLIWRMSRQAA